MSQSYNNRAGVAVEASVAYVGHVHRVASDSLNVMSIWRIKRDELRIRVGGCGTQQSYIVTARLRGSRWCLCTGDDTA